VQMERRKSRRAGRFITAGLTLMLAVAFGASMADAQRQRPQAPLGLPAVPFPRDNPYTPEKAELGRVLYFDTRLSSDNSVSCASCHAPEFGFTDGAAFSTGIGGQVGGRSAPTVINRAYSTVQFWDGRAASLEAQAKGPIANPIEMTHEMDETAAHQAVVEKLRAIPGYRRMFKAAFDNEEFDMDHIAKAIATFERTVLSGNSAFDRYRAGETSAMTEQQVRGMDVFFNKAACDSCHLGFNFTDSSYVNIGIGMEKPDPDLGRHVVSGREEDKGAFKTPSLREIEHTAPYMHDGRFKTLEEVVGYYDEGGHANPWIDQRMKPLKLTDRDKSDLVAFLKALSGDGWQHIQAPEQFPQ
jgi:cytochrome c peroxidase